MQRLFLLLTVIISRAIASPVAQIYPDGSFDIALSGFGDSNIAAPEPFQLAETDAPKKAPNPPQPGDPVIRKQPQPKPKISTEENNPEEEPKVRNQPFDCGEGKSGACCIGVTHEGITSGCVKCTSLYMNRTLPLRWQIITQTHQKKKKNRFHYGKETGPFCKWADSYMILIKQLWPGTTGVNNRNRSNAAKVSPKRIGWFNKVRFRTITSERTARIRKKSLGAPSRSSKTLAMMFFVWLFQMVSTLDCQSRKGFGSRISSRRSFRFLVSSWEGSGGVAVVQVYKGGV